MSVAILDEKVEHTCLHHVEEDMGAGITVRHQAKGIITECIIVLPPEKNLRKIINNCTLKEVEDGDKKAVPGNNNKKKRYYT